MKLVFIVRIRVVENVLRVELDDKAHRVNGNKTIDKDQAHRPNALHNG